MSWLTNEVMGMAESEFHEYVERLEENVKFECPIDTHAMKNSIRTEWEGKRKAYVGVPDDFKGQGNRNYAPYVIRGIRNTDRKRTGGKGVFPPDFLSRALDKTEL